MSVTETLRALGSWNLQFDKIPQDLISKIEYLGHVVIHTGRVDYRREGDAALTSSRYTGVVRVKKSEKDSLTLSGVGMAFWLGDEDDKGSVIENPIVIPNTTSFENSIRAVLPSSGSITEGTLFNIGETFGNTFQYVTPRKAIDYICDTVGADWRVNGNATLDAGRESDLFRTIPKTIVARKQQGVDMSLRAYMGDDKTTQDVEDFSTRVLLLAMGTEASTVTATADINPALNPYKDLHGNTVKLTRMVSESTTDATNAPARAQLQLNRFTGTNDALDLSTDEYDIKGDLVVGDYLWVYDDKLDLIDFANEIKFKGEVLNPMALRLNEMSWPVVKQMSVGYRDWNGIWYDLTDYLVPETGATSLVVGGYNRSLTSGSGGEVVGTRPVADTSVPDQPTWDEAAFRFSVYQNDKGETRAQAELHWLRPDNTDGSTIIDGDHYEIRFRTSRLPLFPVTWAQLAGSTWDQVHNSGGTWDNPLVYTPGQWDYRIIAWDQLAMLLIDLSPNMPYEAQIRAVDGAVPPNYGDWSTVTLFQTSADTIPPTQPAPPQVFTSRIAAQIVHTLGRSDGGTYNMDLDLHHLEVHGQYEPNFTPTDSTLLGKIIATSAFITGQVPAVGTVPIESTNPVWFKVIAVDNDGNRSNPSVAVQQTAQLIDNAHISDLTVTKVTAGTISATWLLAGTIRTGITGARAEMDINGLRLYDPSGTNTVDLNATTGFAFFQGTMQSGSGAQRIVVNPEPTGLARIDMFDDSSSNHTTLVQFGTNFVMQLEANADRSRQGGKVQFGTSTSIFSHASGSNEAFMALGSDEGIQLRGYWVGGTMSGHSAVVIGFDDGIAAGLGNVSYGYGATMANRTSPLGHAYSSEGPWAGYPTMSPDPTGFLVRMPVTANVKGFHWWVFRSL